MRSRRRALFEGMVVAVLVGPHAFGCATFTRGTWEVTRRTDELFRPAKIRSTCGGSDACAALCEEMRDNTLEEPFRGLCEGSEHDSFTIVGCEPRGGTLFITCEWEDEQKGCMPDS